MNPADPFGSPLPTPDSPFPRHGVDMEALKRRLEGALAPLANALAPPEPPADSPTTRIFRGLAELFAGICEATMGAAPAAPYGPQRPLFAADPDAPPQEASEGHHAPQNPFGEAMAGNPDPEFASEIDLEDSARPNPSPYIPGAPEPVPVDPQDLCNEATEQRKDPHRVARLCNEPLTWLDVLLFYAHQLAIGPDERTPSILRSISLMPGDQTSGLWRLHRAHKNGELAPYATRWDQIAEAVAEALQKGHIDVDDQTQILLKLGDRPKPEEVFLETGSEADLEPSTIPDEAEEDGASE